MFVFEYRKNRHSTFTNLLFGFAMGAFSLAILYEYSLVNHDDCTIITRFPRHGHFY